MHSSVKGQWGAQQYGQGDYVFRAGQWFQVVSAAGATADDMPYNPDADSIRTYLASTGYKHGMPVLVEHDDNSTTDINQVYTASALMKGSFESTYQNGDYATNDVVQEGTQFWRWTSAPPSDYQHGNHANNVVVRDGGQFYQANSALTNTVTAPSSDPTNWTPLGSNVSALDTIHVTEVTDQVAADATQQDVGTANPQGTASAYFVASPFQAYSNDGNLTHIGDPTLNLEHDGTTASAGTVLKTAFIRMLTTVHTGPRRTLVPLMARLSEPVISTEITYTTKVRTIFTLQTCLPIITHISVELTQVQGTPNSRTYLTSVQFASYQCMSIP